VWSTFLDHLSAAQTGGSRTATRTGRHRRARGDAEARGARVVMSLLQLDADVDDDVDEDADDDAGFYDDNDAEDDDEDEDADDEEDVETWQVSRRTGGAKFRSILDFGQ
jgi:hypothetical protein